MPNGEIFASLFNAANTTELWAHAKDFLTGLRNTNVTGETTANVDYRQWTYNGTLTGCGLRFRVVGNGSLVASAYFPKLAEPVCGDEVYTMRSSPPNTVYEDRVRLAPDERPVHVELITDGYDDTYVDRLCVDNQLLRVCKQLTNGLKASSTWTGNWCCSTSDGQGRGEDNVPRRGAAGRRSGETGSEPERGRCEMGRMRTDRFDQGHREQ